MGLRDSLFGEDADLLYHADLRLLLLSTAVGTFGQVLLSPLLDTLSGPYGGYEIKIGL
jgi:hypothetical protein